MAGCDEAGRGCLAGPVVAAAVILPKGFRLKGINDSKQLKKEQRAHLRKHIEKNALEWAVGFVTPSEIDEINILNASFRAMHVALDKIKTTPDLLLIDGNRFHTYRSMQHKCVIGGDQKYASIAAASILAKEYRDEYMVQQALKYPHYGWSSNMGYPTAAHRSAIASHGITPLHRRSFQLTADYIKPGDNLSLPFPGSNTVV